MKYANHWVLCLSQAEYKCKKESTVLTSQRKDVFTMLKNIIPPLQLDSVGLKYSQSRVNSFPMRKKNEPTEMKLTLSPGQVSSIRENRQKWQERLQGSSGRSTVIIRGFRLPVTLQGQESDGSQGISLNISTLLFRDKFNGRLQESHIYKAIKSLPQENFQLMQLLRALRM